MESNSSQIKLVKDIDPSGSSYPFIFGEFDDRLYFNATEDGKSRLWVSDGTADGTNQILDPDSITSSSNDFAELDGELHFTSDDGLWITDGTSEGTNLVTDLNPSENNNSEDLTEFGGKLYFSASDEANGKELWVSDGTSEGTNLFKDLNPGIDSSDPEILGEFDDRLYFNADHGEDSNGLWATNGTAEGTNLIIETDSDPDTADPDNFFEFDDRLYFTLEDAVNGKELWVSDGTSKGTNLFTDLNPGADSSNPIGLTELDGQLYFNADDGVNGNELWVTDGTNEGTNLVTDINADGSGLSEFAILTEFDGQLYFNADDGANSGLWTSDGTSEGTTFISETSGRGYVEFNDRLYFVTLASDEESANKLELWSTDGTSEATFVEELYGGIPADDFSAGAGSSAGAANFFIGDLYVVGDELLFNASGESGIDLHRLIVDDTDTDNITGANSDFITGLQGDDSLCGAADNDILSSDLGSDIFVVEPGQTQDTIPDFELGSDRLGLADGLEFSDLSLAGNTVKLGDDNLVRLDNINAEDLTIGDFVDL